MLRRLLIAGACALLVAPATAPAAGRCASAAPPRWVVDELDVLRSPQRPADRLPRLVRRRLRLDVIASRWVRRLVRAPGEERPSYIVPARDRCRRGTHYLCLVSVEPGRHHVAMCNVIRRATLFRPGYLSEYEGEQLRVQAIVPDRVARVELTLPDGQVRTVTPRDNRWVALFPERPGSDPMSPPLRAMRWLDAEGREIARQDFVEERG